MSDPEQSSARHIPVMLAECLEYLHLQPGDSAVDCTLGLGGHSLEILRAVGPTGHLTGLDRDPEALRRATDRLHAACQEWGWPTCPFQAVQSDFRHLGTVISRQSSVASEGDGLQGGPSPTPPYTHTPIQGILFDLGVSSMQLDLAERGFSFRESGPLDMRMGPDADQSAEELVNTRSEENLARILWEYGEERYSRRIARRIVERRVKEPLRTTQDLVDAVWGAYPPKERHGRLHPATRTFQALRIAVNDELAALEPALVAATAALKPGGRVVVLSYHSLEDRIVKRTFEWLSGRCRCPHRLPVCGCGAEERVKILARKPVEPSAEEVERNPRARSARLRAVERLADR